VSDAPNGLSDWRGFARSKAAFRIEDRVMSAITRLIKQTV